MIYTDFIKPKTYKPNQEFENKVRLIKFVYLVMIFLDAQIKKIEISEITFITPENTT